MTLDVRDFTAEDREWASRLLSDYGGGVPQMARLGEILYARLSGMIPDHQDLRTEAGEKLAEERCECIAARVLAMLDRMCTPLVRQLNEGER